MLHNTFNMLYTTFVIITCFYSYMKCYIQWYISINIYIYIYIYNMFSMILRRRECPTNFNW